MPIVLFPSSSLSLSLSLYLIHSLIKASQSTLIIIVIVTRKKATKSLRKEKLFFITLRYSVHCVCLCCIIFYILHIYIHDDFFKRNVIGRDNKRHHNYNQKKICVFLPFSFHINIHLIYIAELSSFR